MSDNLFTETLSIGFTTGVIGLFISTLFMFIFSKNFTLKKYNFWPQIFLSYFITGSIIHLIYEFTNLNKKFCCNRKYKC